MNKRYPRISIVTVNYNGKKFLGDLFNSLYSLDYPPAKLEIIMVDNGSDDSLDYVKKAFPRVITIKNPINNYARANNLGIKKATGEFIGLLNNDTRVNRHWLKELVLAMQENDKIGAAGSKILLMDGRIQSAGHVASADFQWVDRGFGEEDKGQYDLQAEVPSLCGAAVLYRRACLDQVGLLDEDLNMYLEDVDMAKRCKDKGWTLMYVPKSEVYHHYNGMIHDDLLNFFVQRNKILLVAKYSPKQLPAALMTLVSYVKQKGLSAAEADVETIVKDLFLKLMKTYSLRQLRAFIPDVVAALRQFLIKRHELIAHELQEVGKLRAQVHALTKEQQAQSGGKAGGLLKREDLFRTTIEDFERMIKKQNGALCRLNQAVESQAAAVQQKEALKTLQEQKHALDVHIVQLEHEGAQLQERVRTQEERYSHELGESRLLIGSLQKELDEKETARAALVLQKEQEAYQLGRQIQEKESLITSLHSAMEEIEKGRRDYELLYEKQTKSIKELGPEVESMMLEMMTCNQNIRDKELFIEELQREINKTVKIKADLEQICASHEGSLSQKESEISLFRQQIDQKEALVSLLQHEIEATTKIKGELESEWEIQTVALREKDELCDRLRQDLESMRADKDALQALYESQSAALREKENLCGQLQQEKETLWKDLKVKEDHYQTKVREFGERLCLLEEEWEEEKAAFDNTMQEMGRAIINRDREIRECEKQLEQQAGELCRREENMHRQTEAMCRQAEDIQLFKQETQRMLKANEDELNHKEYEINVLDRLLSEQENEVQRLRDHIERFYASRGYRFVLKPLLSILNILKRQKKSGPQ
jgi:GT2 family glycosyltransferase